MSKDEKDEGWNAFGWWNVSGGVDMGSKDCRGSWRWVTHMQYLLVMSHSMSRPLSHLLSVHWLLTGHSRCWVCDQCTPRDCIQSPFSQVWYALAHVGRSLFSSHTCRSKSVPLIYLRFLCRLSTQTGCNSWWLVQTRTDLTGLRIV